MKNTVLRLLNLRSSEVWLVRNLFLVQLFQGIGIAYLFTSANALFLTQYPVDELPKVFMLSAIVLLAVNYVYSKIEHRIHIQKLIIFVLIFSALSILGLRLLIYSVEYKYGAYLLLIWYQVIYLVCGSSFWALAALIFDVRESKRTFSILSAGDSPAKLLGYLTVPVLASLYGVSNLLFISVICMLVSLFFMRSMLRSNKIDFHLLAHKAHQREPLKNTGAPAPWDIVKSLFGNHLIFLIALLSLVVMIALTVIDFTFLSEVKSKYHSDAQLASFLGMFLGVGTAFAILAKTMLTSRIVQRLGVSGSLMLLPILLFAFTVFILLSKQGGSQGTFYLYAFGSMVVFTVLLKSTIQDPLALVLFQPLRPVLRLKGHVISKGIMAPLGLFFAGLFIYINITSKGLMDIGTTCYLLLSMCFAWVVIVYLLNKQYLVSLIESLKSGFFRGNFIVNNDEVVKQALVQKMKSPKSLEVIYAADSLEKLDPAFFCQALIPLFHHEDPDIQKFALKKIKEYPTDQAIPSLKKLLEETNADELKIEVLKALTHLQEGQAELLLEFLDHPQPFIQEEAMAALFSSGDLNAIIRAGQKLLSWLGSADEQDRIRAAVVIGRVADKNFYTSLIQLLNDPSVAVQRQAIIASASTRNIKLVPYLFSKLHVDELRRSIITALAAQGEEAIELMIEREQSTDFDPSMIPHHLEIAALTGGPKSARYLRELLFRQPALKNEIIKALKEAGYESPVNEHGQILDLAAALFDEANSIIGLRNSVNGEQTQILSNALLIELQAREEALFYLFSFVYSRQKILSALDNIRSGNKERMANGAEVLDLTIPKKLCSPLLSLVEYIAGTEPLTSKKVAGPDLMIAMKNLLNRAELSLSAWTRSITIYTMYQMNPKADYSFLQVIPGQADQIFQETKNFVLAKNQLNVNAAY